MERFHRPLDALADLNIPLGHLGNAEITLFGVLKFVLLVAAVYYVSGLIRRLTVDRLLARTDLDMGLRLGIGSVLRYALLVIGFLLIAQNMGIDLTTFNVIAGAVGVGVGFGLQNIVSNFISGLIIMFERPVRVGDRVVLGALEGNVEEIGARRTTVNTDDNLTIIVPNSRFITENVINLRSAASRVRVSVTVQVAAGIDPRVARAALLKVAEKSPNVLEEPASEALLTAVQPGGVLLFELQVWTANRAHAREALRSDLNYAIASEFAAAGVKFD
jgi:small-conductance mechanosensitive channel